MSVRELIGTPNTPIAVDLTAHTNAPVGGTGMAARGTDAITCYLR